MSQPTCPSCGAVVGMAMIPVVSSERPYTVIGQKVWCHTCCRPFYINDMVYSKEIK